MSFVSAVSASVLGTELHIKSNS